MPLSPKKAKAKADAERREREKYPPGTSARLPLPYKPSPDVAKWLTTEKRHWAEDAVAEALARDPRSNSKQLIALSSSDVRPRAGLICDGGFLAERESSPSWSARAKSRA